MTVPVPPVGDAPWMAEQAGLVRQIQAETSELGGAVLNLTAVQARQIVRLRGAVRWTALGLVLDLALTVLGVVLVFKAQDNAHRIEVNQRQVQANQAALRARQAQTKPALCGLYDVLLDSYAPASPAARADPVDYSRAFTSLESGARVFGCAHATRGRD